MTSSTEGLSQFVSVPAPNDLRQGDVLFGFHVPMWNLNDAQIVLSAQGDTPARVVVGLHKRGPHPIIICSNDCDLDNKDKALLGVIVAPLLPWPYDVGSDNDTLLRSSTRVRDRGGQSAYDYVSMWPVDVADPSVEGAPVESRVAHFGAMTSVFPAGKVISALRLRPRLEMTDESRADFAAKLAAYFIRGGPI